MCVCVCVCVSLSCAPPLCPSVSVPAPVYVPHALPPFFHHRAIFLAFLLLVLVLFAMEVALQTLLWSSAGYAAALLVYESCSVVLYV